ESRVSVRGAFVIARYCHSSDNGRENRVERLVDLAQAAGEIDNCAINTHRRECDPWSAANKPSQHEDIQTQNESVKQLVGTDWSRVTEQTLCFTVKRDCAVPHGHVLKQP